MFLTGLFKNLRMSLDKLRKRLRQTLLIKRLYCKCIPTAYVFSTVIPNKKVRGTETLSFRFFSSEIRYMLTRSTASLYIKSFPLLYKYGVIVKYSDKKAI